MQEEKLFDLNILSEDVIPTPSEIKEQVPLSERAKEFVLKSRQTIRDILDRRDDRLLTVVGPCSIHDLKAAHEYARRLTDFVVPGLVVVMRVYFEKPRTTVGWKGFINDPRLDDSFRIDEGLREARKFLLDLAEMGVPAATEALDPITPQYLDDLITWTAIGARTTESQKHREMASGLSTPVGFKNGTDGNIQVAINAIRSAAMPHHFLGINHAGQVAVMHTRGNRYAHIVMRGGDRPNYDSVSIALCERELEKAGLARNIVVDCSHANSFKDPALQPLVLDNCINQIVEGNRSIIGFMLESNLHGGNQTLGTDLSALRYGVSITDGCIDWQTTEAALRKASRQLAQVKRS